ncbi:MAG TPA: plastocyanin/azurin family copper-binding protein [Nitrososphaeraceae archaeon]|jgi:plastocyanin|nr:plastocyanin/azurin family copper-binding protein [Nitrososphaeraceae archaeon]
MKFKELIPLIAIISIILTVGGILMVTNLLPEQLAQRYNPLSEVSIKTDYRVIKTPTPQDNSFIYAINSIAEKALHIAQNDTSIKQIINEQKDKAVTIAAIQPILMEGKNGKLIYNNLGQILITANWQYVDGKFYSNAANFDELQNKIGQSHQHVWKVFVDLNKHMITSISEEPERVMRDTFKPNLIYAGGNMFMPDTVKVNAGSMITWFNNSNLPHNVVGIYKKTGSGSQQQIPVDSGFIESNRSWKYSFNDDGVFEYHCTIHSEDGMKGIIIVSSTSQL